MSENSSNMWSIGPCIDPCPDRPKQFLEKCFECGMSLQGKDIFFYGDFRGFCKICRAWEIYWDEEEMRKQKKKNGKQEEDDDEVAAAARFQTKVKGASSSSSSSSSSKRVTGKSKRARSRR